MSLFMLSTSAFAASGRSVTLNNGVKMPSANLGTCCGSSPSVGLSPWLQAGGTGIDTAFDYSDQTDIAKIINAPGAPPRDSLFITSKIPAGFGNATDCDPDPSISLRYVQENLRELGIKQLDLVLVHRPCQSSQTKDPAASNNALWKGVQQALAMGLTRAIGVSNYRAADLKALDTSGATPSVNQCSMSLQQHDDETIDYCQGAGIVYESYHGMKGCPFSDPTLTAIADKHKKSAAQVCLRWVLERGAILATGTGADASKAAEYAKEDLDIFDFALTADEVDALNELGAPAGAA
jgi:diketogulonate reductase-like aldo/keto reductase